jgi:hypothetical protein
MLAPSRKKGCGSEPRAANGPENGTLLLERFAPPAGTSEDPNKEEEEPERIAVAKDPRPKLSGCSYQLPMENGSAQRWGDLQGHGSFTRLPAFEQQRICPAP